VEELVAQVVQAEAELEEIAEITLEHLEQQTLAAEVAEDTIKVSMDMVA
jgi:hypothetical protein